MMKLKQRMRLIVDSNDTSYGRFFDLSIQFLIVFSIVSFTIETLPNISPRISNILGYAELVTIIIFTAEYLLRLYVSEKKLSFIFSFYGMIDLLAILPFYIASGIDLRSIRIIRLFRLFRTFKVLRYNRAIERFRVAFLSIRTELTLFAIATLFLLYFASVGIYYFENEAQPEIFASVLHSLWWAVATLTSVGYGDIYPVTTAGKIFTSVIVLIGLGIIAVPTGLLASALAKSVKKNDQEPTNNDKLREKNIEKYTLEDKK